jgi:hypothetical protein
MTEMTLKSNSILATFSKNVATNSLDVNQKNLVNATIVVNKSTMYVDLAAFGQHTFACRMGHTYVFQVFSEELPLGKPSVHGFLNITYYTLGLYDLIDYIKDGHFKFGGVINDNYLFSKT